MKEKPFENIISDFMLVPNDIIDEIMPRVTPADFKVLFAVIRLTWGWRGKQNGDFISLSQLISITGLSHQGVKNSIKNLGTMLNIRHGNRTTNFISLNREFSLPDWIKTKDGNSVASQVTCQELGNSTAKLLGNSAATPNTEEKTSKKEDFKNANPATPEPAAEPKKLDIRIKKAADPIYQSDRKKFDRLVIWLKKAERQYPVDIIVLALEKFAPFAAEVVDWWPYLDKIIDKGNARANGRKAETESEEFKRQEREWLKSLCGT